jgi:hypothetical protein
MTWRIETVTIAGRQYVSECRLIAERRGPENDLETDRALTVPLADERGKLQWTLEPNPDYGKADETGAVDGRRYQIVHAPQKDTPEELAERERQEQRQKITAALPDILLAVAEGTELRAAIQSALTGGGDGEGNG